MVSKRVNAIAGSTLLAVMLLAPCAYAQPSPAEKETARSLMIEGRARRDRKDVKGSLESFQAADAIMHVPTTGFEVARAQVALGQLVEARDTLRRVLRIAAKSDDPRPFAEARASAQQLDDELAERIPSLHVVVSGAPEGASASAQIDAMNVPAEAMSVPIRLNPGHHTITVTAGGATGHGEVVLDERATKTVTIELPASAPADPAATPIAESPATDAHPHTMRTLAYVGFGVAIAGAAAGTITGLMSLSKTSSVKQSCDGNACPGSVQSDLDTAKSTATVSTIAFVVAGAGLGVGLTALIIGDGDGASKETGRAHVTPWIGAGSAGLRGSF